MATINLGAIKFNWKGAYNSSTSYAVDDVVSSGGNSYVCIQAHSNQAVGNATAYWNIMSSAGTNGTNGTDLTSTLSARGDIVYKGASALTRLPKGTAGYYLKQGANDPEWAEAGGTHVKIATLEHSSNVSAVNFTSCFTTDYDIYKVYFTGIYGDTNNYELGIGLVDASGNQINSNNTAGVYSYIPTGGGSAGSSFFGEDADARIRIIGNNIDSVANEPSHLELTIYNPYETKHTTMWYNYMIRSNNNHYYHVTGAAQTRNSDSARSLKVYSSGGGNLAGYKGTIYGVKR